MYVCMYVCMCVCACMHEYMFVCTYVHINGFMYVCIMHAGMYVCY